MFDFMLDTEEQPAGVLPAKKDADAKDMRVSSAMAPLLRGAPQPVYIPRCIYNCGTTADQLEKYGTIMSFRKQTYICWSCMNQFNIMTAEDRKRSGR